MKNPRNAGDRQMSREPVCTFVGTVLDGLTPRR